MSSLKHRADQECHIHEAVKLSTGQTITMQNDVVHRQWMYAIGFKSALLPSESLQVTLLVKAKPCWFGVHAVVPTLATLHFTNLQTDRFAIIATIT